jgi:mono/diheme cytochrome c family protein
MKIIDLKLAGALVILACLLTACARNQDDQALLARGTYLMEGIVACGNCHTPRASDGTLAEGMTLAGGFLIEDPGLIAYAPNITQDDETGIGAWSDEEIMRAIREGIRPDGTVIGPPMPIISYRAMSDYDVRAIVAYLRTVEPVRNVVQRSVYQFPLPESWGPPLGSVPDVSRDDHLAYGTYLSHIGHCMECHTPLVEGQFDFSRAGEGGMVFNKPFGLEFAAIAANITPNAEVGIGTWSDADIKRAVTQGVSRDGRQLLPVMAFSSYRNVTDEDLNDLVVYLRSLPPQPAN